MAKNFEAVVAMIRHGVVALVFAGSPLAAFGQALADAVNSARSCIETNGVAACAGFLGTCDPVWAYERRRGCAETIASNWDLVLLSYLADQKPLAAAFDANNNRDNVPPIGDALEREQEVWLTYRDAHCAVSLTGEYIVTGPEESAALCQTKLTIDRVSGVIDLIAFFLSYVNDFK
ncbi:MAG: lysozyme inhibitor LprI family protein [Deltaproteobacteria bacterium]